MFWFLWQRFPSGFSKGWRQEFDTWLLYISAGKSLKHKAIADGSAHIRYSRWIRDMGNCACMPGELFIHEDSCPAGANGSRKEPPSTPRIDSKKNIDRMYRTQDSCRVRLLRKSTDESRRPKLPALSKRSLQKLHRFVLQSPWNTDNTINASNEDYVLWLREKI